MRVLAFDAAMATGWAFGPSPLAWGTERMPGDANNGARFLAFAAFLNRMADKFHADTLAIESPLPMKSIAQTRLAFGWLACAQAVAAKRGLRFVEAHNNTIKKAFTGRGGIGKRKKGETNEKPLNLAECERRGIAVTNDNEADAVALLHFVIGAAPPRARAA